MGGIVAQHNQPSLVASGVTEMLTRIIRARRRRASLFSAELFADPAWDILLDLSLARLERRSLTAADLVRVSPLNASTVLRWVAKLEQDGWIEAGHDPSARGVLDLSQKGAAAMQIWIDEWFEGQQGRPDDRVTSLLERIDRGRRSSRRH